MKFEVGDIIRCKKKYSPYYGRTDMFVLCCVVRYIERRRVYRSGKRGSRIMTQWNVSVKIIQGYDKGSIYPVFDFHFRKATEADKKHFALMSL